MKTIFSLSLLGLALLVPSISHADQAFSLRINLNDGRSDGHNYRPVRNYHSKGKYSHYEPRSSVILEYKTVPRSYTRYADDGILLRARQEAERATRRAAQLEEIACQAEDRARRSARLADCDPCYVRQAAEDARCARRARAEADCAAGDAERAQAAYDHLLRVSYSECD